MNGIFEKVGMDVGIVVIILIVIVLFLAIVVMKQQLQMDRLNRKYRLFMKGSDGQSLEKMIQRKLNQLDKVQEVNEDHAHILRQLKSIILHNAIFIHGTILNAFQLSQNMCIVKYDAFDDVGGKLSFAFAMLNKYDTGIVLNAVHSRDNCFLYIKEIMKGESYIMLSEEEIEALRIAKGSREN